MLQTGVLLDQGLEHVLEVRVVDHVRWGVLDQSLVGWDRAQHLDLLLWYRLGLGRSWRVARDDLDLLRWVYVLWLGRVAMVDLMRLWRGVSSVLDLDVVDALPLGDWLWLWRWGHYYPWGGAVTAAWVTPDDYLALGIQGHRVDFYLVCPCLNLGLGLGALLVDLDCG